MMSQESFVQLMSGLLVFGGFYAVLMFLFGFISYVVVGETRSSRPGGSPETSASGPLPRPASRNTGARS